MNKSLQWTLGLSTVLIVLTVVFVNVAPFFFPAANLNYGYGMMGGRGGLMGGGYGFGMMPFGGFMFLIPLIFMALIIGGTVVIVRAFNPTLTASAPKCGQCGKTLQAGWKACPYCGEKI